MTTVVTNTDVPVMIQVMSFVTNASGTLADPDTLTVKVTPPSGAAVADMVWPGPSIQRTAVGRFSAKIPIDDRVGAWNFRIETTGAVKVSSSWQTITAKAP